MKTKIISVAGEKGGVGKTTLNIMLATNLFHTYGKKVVLLDVDDPQFSIFKKRRDFFLKFQVNPPTGLLSPMYSFHLKLQTL